jgi:mannose-6-phosphate isomerase
MWPVPRFDTLLRFRPLYQTRVWGGRRLETQLHRTLPDGQPYGESWDLVDRDPEQSIVASGAHAGLTLHALWTAHRAEVFGPGWMGSRAPRFPVLVKILDCADDLSIQVHPPAALAAALGGEPKTEMWFVAGADPGARVHAGLRAGVTRARFEQALRDGTVADCVPHLDARTGDSLFVPSGRLHALGRGLLIFEIQQNSDTTYRVFDWNRAGLDGRPRPLHVEASLACIDFTDVEPVLHHGGGVLADCADFRVSRARTGHPGPRDDARIVMAIAGMRWGGETLAPGDVALRPASARLPEPEGEWLEIQSGAGAAP